jgi:hypothetical protein
MANNNNPWNSSHQLLKKRNDGDNKRQNNAKNLLEKPKMVSNFDNNGNLSYASTSNSKFNRNDKPKLPFRVEKPEFEDEIKTRSSHLVSKIAKPTGNDVVVKVIANFIPIRSQHEVVVKQFHVDFLTPIEETNRKLKFAIIQQLKSKISYDFFDGGNQLFSINGFDNQTLEALVDGVIYQVKFSFIQNISSLRGDFNAVTNILIRRVIGRSMGMYLMGR